MKILEGKELHRRKWSHGSQGGKIGGKMVNSVVTGV